jgi:hypothetical protein
MAKPPKYPLQPLLEHRARQVDDATVELGDAVLAREAAEAGKARAEVEELEARTRADAIRGKEAERLSRGELRAGDLARQEAWEVGARGEAAVLAEATARADSKARESRDAEERARAALAGKKAERDVVAKDRARFDERRKREDEKAEEEAAEEAFAGGRK